MPHDSHIVIAGNGVAGNSAASAIRRTNKGTAITIISQEPYLEYSACTLSKKYLSGERSRKEVFLKTIEDYSRNKITTIFGQKVTAIDLRGKKVILEQEKGAYDKLILATGGTPAIPSLSGVEKKGVFTLKSLADDEKKD
jgi:NAD(P)H-nitrite reductase large subunit